MPPLPQNLNPPTAAWKSFATLIGETVGPFAVVTYAAQKFVSSLAQSALNAQKLKDALGASSGAEQLRKQFEGLGMSASQAAVKVNELAKIASSGAFSFEALGAASRNLQVVGGAALNTAANIKKVQDVAAAAGAPIDAVATAYANLMVSMRGGGGAEAASQMASLGAISQATAQKVADLSNSGASFSEKFGVVQLDLQKSKGAADALASSLTGLSAQLANLQTANQIKIGDMFAEGEKAAKRAEIGFEKIRAAVDETASAPFAAISSAFNSVKEAIAGFGSSDGAISAIKNLVAVIGSAAIGVLAASAASILLVVANLGRLAVAGAAQIGLWTRMGSAIKAWTGLSAGAVGGISAIVAVLAVYVTALMSAIKATEDFIAAGKEQNDAASSSSAKLEARAESVKGGTVEDKKQALDDADAAVSEAEERVKTSKKTLEEKQAASDLNPFKAGRVAEAEGQLGMAEQDLLRKKNARASISSVDSNSLGMDRENLQKKFRRNDIEEDIRNSAFQQLQSSVSPEAATAMAESELSRANQKLATNEATSKASYEERNKLNDASLKVVSSDGAAAKEKALSELESMQTSTKSGGLQQQIDYKKSLNQEKDSSNLDAEAAGREKQDAINKRNTLRAQFSGFSKEDAQGNPIDARGNRVEGAKFDAANAAVEAATKKEADARARQAQVKDRIEKAGGVESVGGKAIQALEIERDAALKREDPNKAREEQEAANLRAQSAREARAAQSRSIATSRDRANLESNLAGLSDTGANAEFKLNAESQQKQSENVRALEAARLVDQKSAEYASARGGPQEEQKRKELEAAKTAAAAAGVDGRSVDQIKAQLDIEKQVLATKLQAAKVAEAAAKSEYDSAMRRLNVEKQVAQLRLAEAEGAGGKGVKGKTEAAIKQDAAKSDVLAEQKALAAAKARDAAEEAFKQNQSPQNKEALDKANLAAAEAGVGSRRTRDVEKDLQSKQTELGSMQAQEASGLSDARDELRMQSLRATEKYGSSYQSRESAKKEADALEDRISKDARVKELTSGPQGIQDRDTAEKIADIEVKRSRIQKDIEEQGTVPVSSMARIGGSSGFAGMVNTDQNKNKKLEELNQHQVELMEKLNKRYEDALNFARATLHDPGD
jgi:hypothetical protein